jgi:hypothetical protein
MTVLMIRVPVQPGFRFEFKLAARHPVGQCNLSESLITRG